MSLREYFPSLGFIGAGNMAGAILRSVVRKDLLDGSQCAVTDVLKEKTRVLHDELGARECADVAELLDCSRAVVLATKPQDLRAALQAAAGHVDPEHLIISIAAGVPARAIEALLPAGTRVVRVMPNTPALIGEGAAGVAPGGSATRDDVDAVMALFSAVGLAAEVKESDLDAITALSGSGPAYVFRFMELMMAAGEEMGLAPEAARKLTLQTFVGASRLAMESPESPAELRKRVTSKGGTTAAALEEFERRGLEETIKSGLKRACARSAELAAGF